MDGSFFLLPFIAMGGLIGLASFGFWIWMLIDAATNEPSYGNDKIVWILVIVFTGFIGAAIYYFVRRSQRMSTIGR